MNASGGSPAGPSIIGWIFRLILVGVSAYFIYWAYKKLYEGPAETTVILKDIYKADPSKAFTFAKDKLPALFEGGEYSVSMWMYVNGWANSNRYQFNKDVLALGDLSTNGNMTLGIYLDSRDNVLHVRTGTMLQSGSNSGSPTLKGGDYDALFTSMTTTPIAGADTPGDCTISPFALQRWVHVVVALSGKTCDVYMDGKLTRSCVLDGLYTAAPNYSLRIAGNNGFAGFLSGVKVFAYALNPEEVYRTYMAGPLGAVSWSEYVKSLFDPKAIGTLDYPKMNV